MSIDNHLKLYVQDLVHSYSGEYNVQLTEDEAQVCVRQAVSQIELLAHDMMRELVSEEPRAAGGSMSLTKAEMHHLRFFRPAQSKARLWLRRILPI